jgi:tetratricopeptide (TPR) repeat protein
MRFLQSCGAKITLNHLPYFRAMTKALLCCALLLMSVVHSYSQIDGDEDEKLPVALIPVRILSAKHEFNVNNIRGALTMYREVLEVDPTNATVLYGIAQCHYASKKYKLAREYAYKAASNGGDVEPLFLGMCYQRTAELDTAISYFTKVISSERKGSDLSSEAEWYIAQCRFAKEKMAHPVDVTITKLGTEINTRFEEYTPSITADGKTLFFTSRRSDTRGGRIDEFGDYKYFEDIYIAEWDSIAEAWSSSVNLPGELNTEAYDAVLSVVPDGSGLFVYRNKGESAGDIFFSDRNASDGSFKEAFKFPRPINSSYYEGSVSITEDGNTLFFISERPEGMGNGDIYRSDKKSGKWSSPKNLGPIINTVEDEKFVFIHPNGKTLFFASKGHRTMGSYDIFRSDVINGEWTAPINLGYPINTVNEESTFSLTRDNSKLYIAAEYDEASNDRDIYVIDVSRYTLIAGGYERSFLGQLFCEVKDSKGQAARNVQINIYLSDGKEILATDVTDKAGHVRINMEGDKAYRVEAISEGKTVSREVTLALQLTGETVVKVPLILP